ncbi:MAG: glycine cleavage system protein GcvH [Candidatus Omnitrophica bacterium]|nr:glycine cleavage system protein GcvH [Candidatus Omnitrophota bacterium]
MQTPQELRYTKTHEWAKVTPHEIAVGITAHAQEELRDVVYVELPPVGKVLKQGEPAAVVESVKAAFDIYAPVSGTVTRANADVTKSPQLVNTDCYGAGWFFAVQPSQPAEVEGLLTAEAYAKLIAAAAH